MAEKKFFEIRVVEDPDPDGSFSGRYVPVDKEVLERIIQEEIWAQTLWPEGEPTLSEILAKHKEGKT